MATIKEILEFEATREGDDMHRSIHLFQERNKKQLIFQILLNNCRTTKTGNQGVIKSE